jgi:hypothetical protein
MKIKRSQLKQIIKEEVKRVLWEQQRGVTHQWADAEATGDEGFPDEFEAFMAEYPEEFLRNEAGEFDLTPEDHYAAYFGHPIHQPPTDLDVTDPDNPRGLRHYRQQFRSLVGVGALTHEGEQTAVARARDEAEISQREAGPDPAEAGPDPAGLWHIPERDCPPGGCRETNIPYPPPPEREGQ